jgi:hypothetical protein
MSDGPHLCLVTLQWLLSQYGPALTGEAIASLISSEKEARERDREIFHFGVWENDSAGHYTHGENGRTLGFNQIGPWTMFDGNLAPGGRHKDVEGATAIHYFEGWTAISFWDRSSDTRGGCNTGFFVARVCSFEELCELAEERYPKQWKRLNVKPFWVQTFDEKWSKVYANKRHDR